MDKFVVIVIVSIPASKTASKADGQTFSFGTFNIPTGTSIELNIGAFELTQGTSMSSSNIPYTADCQTIIKLKVFSGATSNATTSVLNETIHDTGSQSLTGPGSKSGKTQFTGYTTTLGGGCYYKVELGFTVIFKVTGTTQNSSYMVNYYSLPSNAVEVLDIQLKKLK